MSVWDRLGVERPFMVRLFGGLPEWKVDKERTALVIVDMQHYCALPGKGIWTLAHERGMADELQYYYQRLSLITANLARLLAACREQGVQVIHVNGDVHLGRLLRLTRKRREGRSVSGAKHTRSTDELNLGLGQRTFDDDALVIAPLRPLPDEIVIKKRGAGPFGITNIDQVLRALDIEYLIIGGVATHQCVEMTVRGAFEFGYKVTLVEDGTGTVSDEVQRASLIALADWFCKVKTSEEILGEILVPDSVPKPLAVS